MRMVCRLMLQSGEHLDSSYWKDLDQLRNSSASRSISDCHGKQQNVLVSNHHSLGRPNESTAPDLMLEVNLLGRCLSGNLNQLIVLLIRIRTFYWSLLLIGLGVLFEIWFLEAGHRRRIRFVSAWWCLKLKF